MDRIKRDFFPPISNINRLLWVGKSSFGTRMSHMNYYQKDFDQAHKYYLLWKKQGCYCPALKSKILITNKGWNHLIGGKDNHKRTQLDKCRRFRVLPYAKIVLEASSTIQDIRLKHSRLYYSMDAVTPIEENEVKHLRKIRGVIYEDIKGNRIFLSLMDKKCKVPHASVSKTFAWWTVKTASPYKDILSSQG